MSSTIFGKPEYRLAFDHPHITVTRAGESESERVFDLASPTLLSELRRLGVEIGAAGARLTVILPEGEVWRGRLALGGTRPRDRGRAARVRAAEAMGLPAAALAVRLGRIGRDGSVPAAAVRRETLVETRGFLARAGLRPERITGAGAFDGFPAAPRLDGTPFAVRPQQAFAAAGGTLAAAVLLALLFRPDGAPPPSGLIGPVPLASVATEERPAQPDIAQIAPRRRPADLVRVAALPAASDSKPDGPLAAPSALQVPAIAAEPPLRPLVTMASRNMPITDLPPAPVPDIALRLSELNVARARLADILMATPLIRETVTAATSLPSAALAVRDAGSPAVAPPVPAVVPPVVPARMPVAAAPKAPEITARRPAPRPVPDPVPDPAPDPAPAAANHEPVATPPAAAEPAKTAAVAPDMTRPRPRDVAASQISAALSAAVVTAGVSTARQAASTPPAATQVASLRPEPRSIAVASAVAPKATPKASPSRTASTARAAAPAPQRVAAVQPARPAPVAARRAAPAPQRVAAVQTARPAQQTATRQAPQTQRRAVAAQPARSAPALAPTVARTRTSNATTSATAAAAATETVGFSRRTVSLIGIFGQDKNRYAMVRLPNGSMQRVTAGDRIQGTQVAAIGQNSVQLSGGGRTTTLNMPN